MFGSAIVMYNPILYFVLYEIMDKTINPVTWTTVARNPLAAPTARQAGAGAFQYRQHERQMFRAGGGFGFKLVHQTSAAGTAHARVNVQELAATAPPSSTWLG